MVMMQSQEKLSVLNTSGFGLIEVMVAVGISTVLLTGLMQFTNISGKAQKNVGQATDFNNVIAGMQLTLGKSEVCKLNFQNVSFSSSDLEKTVFLVDNNGSATTTTVPGIKSNATGGILVGPEGQVGSASLRVKEITLINIQAAPSGSGPVDTYTAQLRIRADKTDPQGVSKSISSLGAPAFVNTTLTLSMHTKPGGSGVQVDACSVTGDTVAAACAAFDGSMVGERCFLQHLEIGTDPSTDLLTLNSTEEGKGAKPGWINVKNGIRMGGNADSGPLNFVHNPPGDWSSVTLMSRLNTSAQEYAHGGISSANLSNNIDVDRGPAASRTGTMDPFNSHSGFMFRRDYSFFSCKGTCAPTATTSASTNTEGYVFERTDGNSDWPSGGFAFVAHGNAGEQTNMTIASDRTTGGPRVGIGVVWASHPLDVRGDVGLLRPDPVAPVGPANPVPNIFFDGIAFNPAAAAAAPAPSDTRLKKNFSEIEDPLDKVLSLHGVEFDWNDTARKTFSLPTDRQIGFKAQEVERVIPELVTNGMGGYKNVNYNGVVPVLVEAIKQQQQQIDRLTKVLCSKFPDEEVCAK